MPYSNKVPFPESEESSLSQFARDVREGLSASPRYLSSKYFYDQKGDQLFQSIMAMPEYYLTDCEMEIFQNCAPELSKELGDQPLDLIELGAGDGTKTQHLIDGLLKSGINLRYLPIDISANALKGLGKRIHSQWPDLPFIPLQGDYFSALQALRAPTEPRRRLFLFPGGNIGNFSPDNAHQFLRKLSTYFRQDDYLLTGFDLKKDPAVILAAYNDETGHTAAFNLNLLSRINRELGADFDLNQWRHWETYEPLSGAARSCLVSHCAQQVYIKAFDISFNFAAWETISVEISQKYSLQEIEAMAAATGYQFVQHLQDKAAWFSDSLWKL